MERQKESIGKASGWVKEDDGENKPYAGVSSTRGIGDRRMFTCRVKEENSQGKKDAGREN